MGVLASQITSLTIVYPNVYSGADQRKHQSSASLAVVRVIHRWQIAPLRSYGIVQFSPINDINLRADNVFYLC